MSKITIVFPQGGIIPAAVLGLAKDRDVPALEPVSVPAAYGKHLIEDRFAVPAEPDEASRKKEAKAKAEALAAARRAVAEAEAGVKAAGEDARAAAEAALEDAKAALAALGG